MEILGVMHVKKYIDPVDNYLQEMYPEGIGSLMLEIEPPAEGEDHFSRLSKGYFFDELALRYQDKTDVIFGDFGEWDRHRHDFLMDPLWNLSDTLPARLRRPLDFFINELDSSLLMMDTLIGEDLRTKRMADAVAEEKPDVVIVGGLHASYLKKRFPEATYTRFVPTFPSPWLLADKLLLDPFLYAQSRFRNRPHPDRIVAI